MREAVDEYVPPHKLMNNNFTSKDLSIDDAAKIQKGGESAASDHKMAKSQKNIGKENIHSHKDGLMCLKAVLSRYDRVYEPPAEESEMASGT